jgi:putative SOS response-associated peptidase YedK
MCNLYDYEMTPEIMASIIEHYRLVGKDWTEAMRMQNAPKQVYPNRSGPVVVVQDGQRVVRTDMLWGFPQFKSLVLTNFRNTKLKMWRDWLDQEHRCVVPAMYFAEPDRTTSKPVIWRWFGRRDGQPFFFAGIWRPWTGDRGSKPAPHVANHLLYSIMTTEPNGIVQPIHEKAMPVMLMTQGDVSRWLNGNLEEALELQKPAQDDQIVIVERKKAA